MTKGGIVYMIMNCINGKKYIGRDANANPSYLGGGRRLKIAIRKYGRDNFIKITLRKCPDKEDRLYWEQYYLDLYNAKNNPNLYNISPSSLWGAEGTGKVVYQYDKNGLFVCKFDSCRMAHRDTGINGSTIARCVIGASRSAGGYFWSYNRYEVYPFLVSHKSKMKPVIQFDLNGNSINEFNSITEACLHVGADKRNVSDCLRGKTKTCHKYKWEFKEVIH